MIRTLNCGDIVFITEEGMKARGGEPSGTYKFVGVRRGDAETEIWDQAIIQRTVPWRDMGTGNQGEVTWEYIKNLRAVSKRDGGSRKRASRNRKRQTCRSKESFLKITTFFCHDSIITKEYKRYLIHI